MRLFSAKESYNEADNSSYIIEENPEKNDIAVTSPLEIKLRERVRSLDGLKNRVSELDEAFHQMAQLSRDSEKTVGLLSSFLDQSKLDAENDKRLQAENAKLSTENLNKDRLIGHLQSQVEDQKAEIDVQKKRLVENREVIEKARLSLVELREQKQLLTEELNVNNIELSNERSKHEELTDQYDAILKKYDQIDNMNVELKLELEEEEKKHLELQQVLAGNTSNLEEETKKHKSATHELELLKLGRLELNQKLIEANSTIEMLNQELDHTKYSVEDGQRKFNNHIFTLKTELQNLTSSRTVVADTLKSEKEENNALKKKVREAEKRLQVAEENYRVLQKTQESDREILLESNSKLSDLSLRYNVTMTETKYSEQKVEQLETQVRTLADENKVLKHCEHENKRLINQVNELNSFLSEYQKLIGDKGPAKINDRVGDGFSIDDTYETVDDNDQNVIPIREE